MITVDQKSSCIIQNEQPCWTCQNACGGCSWSRSFRPVSGWDAERSIQYDSYKGRPILSYKINSCPEYIHD